MAHSDPYLASLEQRIALGKLHAISIVIGRELLRHDGRPLSPKDRETLIANADEALALLTGSLLPLGTPVLDDAISKLEDVEDAVARREELVEVREGVRASLKKLHDFVGANVGLEISRREAVENLAVAAGEFEKVADTIDRGVRASRKSFLDFEAQRDQRRVRVGFGLIVGVLVGVIAWLVIS